MHKYSKLQVKVSKNLIYWRMVPWIHSVHMHPLLINRYEQKCPRLVLDQDLSETFDTTISKERLFDKICNVKAYYWLWSSVAPSLPNHIRGLFLNLQVTNY